MRFLVLLLALSLFGCRHEEKTRCPLLEKYAERNDIPRSELGKFGTQWPQFVRDYSVAHGPALSREERREFTSWQVK